MGPALWSRVQRLQDRFAMARRSSHPALPAAAALVAAMGWTGPAPARSAEPVECPQAAIADVDLPAGAVVDEIRVIVAAGSRGAAEVHVESADGDRVVHVDGGSRGLSFFPALDGDALRISLDPVFVGPAACVERIELYGGGARLARVVP